MEWKTHPFIILSGGLKENYFLVFLFCSNRKRFEKEGSHFIPILIVVVVVVVAVGVENTFNVWEE
jgi:hypothetical protein